MALEYGKQKVTRFMYDKEKRKLVFVTRQEILEDGVAISQTYPQIVARDEDFDTVMERLMPSSDKIKEHIETEGKKIIEEQKQAKKDKEK